MASKDATRENLTKQPLAKKTASWSLAQVLIFTVFGALAATLLSSYLPTQAAPSTNADAFDVSKVKIISFDPLIVHITDFVSKDEREHLLKLGTPLLSASVIRDASGKSILSSGRTSSTAFLPSTDPTVSRIATRAATFQGFLTPADVEVQITSYTAGQEYKHHYDWYPSTRPRNRVSTFFAILKSSCSDCGTEFPFFNTSARGVWDRRWCGVLDCGKDMLTTRNVEGSAVFWANLDTQLLGRRDMLHAGLPAMGGEKVGLNVWTDVSLDEVYGRGMFGGWSREWYRQMEMEERETEGKRKGE
ncbi:hypothetical protein HBH56_027710 [Parastagonospora nodorum]|uniref:Prolyl 4-hydroxylase alpha subunit domain-containing protein n=1 Tax=Phaeosphaeria nodorum (strain SN15 / ATCC MYA-4574 / FGSC 10173) TaxID=321614 RepID=A0A7U2F5E2_PHANO|nr:hypothetical protein HBH56_027710 [Parastagonospora nodorum]QRC99054.1 hypothetical protein JI435_064000 [Parastagonospora nodorum SN15]KAH3934544.1 hypothetical protein HBH54_054340 [Parastagonospora nodorum]KAH4039088.1 hypothetical protein HBI09_043740 [Parastagonospora nodorum]KAH4141805.1 hypothetical protein HBH45_062450 [Parastagonospora nodorum]